MNASRFTAEIAESAKRSEAERLDAITDGIIGAAIQVHRELEPGLLESAYEACLAHELGSAGLPVERQKPLPVACRGVRLDAGYRVDLIVGREVTVEIKSVERLMPIHRAQLLFYLRLSGLKVGLLINFNVQTLRTGIDRVVRGFPDSPRTRCSRR
jgi:GxxExxY protein